MVSIVCVQKQYKLFTYRNIFTEEEPTLIDSLNICLTKNNLAFTLTDV